MDKKIYQLQKLANRKTGYPIATIAYYGPDNQFASKAVIGIIVSEKGKEVQELKKWFAADQDVRQDPKILYEMIDFINANQVHRVALTNKIIGCPHEEGIDYPLGETCPQCPYWANRDRWTGNLISVES
jgi:hypothetical protein